jgi:uncharacterized delta-60 repeat protein
VAAAGWAAAMTAAAATAENANEPSIFSKGGIATESLGIHFEETGGFSNIEARSDGGVVAQLGSRLKSYLANGQPDPAAPPTEVSASRKVVPLSGGKSLIVQERSVTRVNPDGSVDTGFGGTGTIGLPIEPQAAAELPTGKVLVVSTRFGGARPTPGSVSVELIEPDGSLDEGLGNRGTLTMQFPIYGIFRGAVALALTGDGGALVIGDGFLLELRADGSPNLSFGSGGWVTGLPSLVGGRVSPDGSVEAVGSGPSPYGGDLVVLRYSAAGTPATGFGPEGIRRFDFGGEEKARVASWATDGSVTVGGATTTRGSCSEEDCEEAPIVTRFNPDGDLDPGFGEGGVVRLAALAAAPANVFGDGVAAMTHRPDGSIVVAGDAPPESTIAFLAALSADGALIPGFGEGGIVRERRPVPATQTVGGLIPLADGRLLAAGTTDVGVRRTPVLIRYEPDGGLDRSFGAGAGYVSFGGFHTATGFAVNATGQALVGIYDYPHSRLLLRAADGAAVTSFGFEGSVQLPSRVEVEALGFDGEGSPLVVGSHDVAGEGEPGVVLRFEPDGKPDSGFGHDGKVVLRPHGGKAVKARALAVEAGRRMLVGGIVGRRFVMTRLLGDGRPDPRFGVDGWAMSRVGGVAESVELRHIGSHIYVAGIARHGDGRRVVLLRFSQNGRMDSAFGHHGRRALLIDEGGRPKAIVPSRKGIFVVLSRGTKPLIFFGFDGSGQRYRIGGRPQLVTDVRATMSGSRLVLGWNAFSKTIRRNVYYLASRSIR